METFLPITYLNDFVFCPYSIYLHQVFDNSNEVVYSANPQQTGKSAHKVIDTFAKKKSSSNVLKGIYVISNRLGIYGKIDTLYIKQQKLVESKYHISTIYKGYYYQIWAQYFALTEMGYTVSELCFYSIKDKRTISLDLPGEAAFAELRNHIRKIAHFDFESNFTISSEKCKHCIYASLCDKTNTEHVYA